MVKKNLYHGVSSKEPACQCRRSKETWVRSLGWEDPLEKEMSTHSSILAWEIPWTEEPGRLQCAGSQRVRHDLATKQQQMCVCAQLCPTLCDPMDCSPPASFAHGILQERILEWVDISFSKGSSPPKDLTQVS